jgi:hypothetical protein
MLPNLGKHGNKMASIGGDIELGKVKSLISLSKNMISSILMIVVLNSYFPQ